ncbi:hypothetical protein FFK22_036580 [Mycobacterium sp. KBS0706]|uniref:hypothetical protein n=1 Tax=Mycobacterium sp. KBS0706 TaxID=2578109 RepID=UPI00110FB04E|nr:hypothetical protein [Mycobacterium sp. KBS0706]TSD83679.1 hypothetical protein FFK22_036580 [Mycobacterium sp. KBS0706]
MVGISNRHFDDDTKGSTRSSHNRTNLFGRALLHQTDRAKPVYAIKKLKARLREYILALPASVPTRNFDLATLFEKPLQIFHSKESMMSILKIARPVAIATLLALGVGAAGSAQALTGIKSQHGPCELQSKDQQGPTCPPDKR